MSFACRMAGLDDVVRRLEDDPAFEDEIASDPRGTLAGFTLDVDELTTVARRVEAATARLEPADQRRSRAAFFALLSTASRQPTGSA